MGIIPGISQLLVLSFAHNKVDEINNKSSYHQHLQVEAIPIAPEMKWYL